MASARAKFPFDLVIMLGDNMYGGQRPADFVKKFEQPYAAAAGGRREIPGLARQPRSAREHLLQVLQHERAALLLVCPQQRPVLRARQHAHGSETDRVDRCVPQGRAGGLEDLLLPSSAVLECQPPRILGRSARPAGADLHQARRQRRLLGPRSRLRAGEAAERDLLLRVGRGGAAAARQHETNGSDRRVLRPGPELHAGGDCRRRTVLPGDLTHGQNSRLRRDPPASRS